MSPRLVCFYCGGGLQYWRGEVSKGVPRPLTALTRDHVIPKRVRGVGGKSPIVICCNDCNRQKGWFTLEEFRAAMAVRNAGLKVDYSFPGEAFTM